MGDGETELSVRSRVPVPCRTPIWGHTAAFREAVASPSPEGEATRSLSEPGLGPSDEGSSRDCTH